MDQQDFKPKIGVLAPYLGGYYYGMVLAGIARAATARNSGVIAIQTKGTDLFGPDETTALPVALDAVDGFILVNDFALPRVIAAIRERGKPLVCIGSRPPDTICSILADNRQGTKSAVLHLVEHGHRRIGFVGFLEHLDIRERYQGYLDAHHEAGLAVDPMLLFAASNNLELDGREAGKRIVEAQVPCTAIVAATDKNAIGVVFAIRAAGYRVPEDIAIVGFDDIEAAQYSDPPLSTIRQRFDLLGERAAETLLRALTDQEPLPVTLRVPSRFVARRSCGCAPTHLAIGAPVSTADPARASVLRQALLELAATQQMTDVAQVDWPGAEQMSEVLSQVARGDLAAADTKLKGAWEGFLKTERDVETVDRAITLLEEFGRSWAVHREAQQQVQCVIRQLRVDLMRAWMACDQSRSRYYDIIVEANARINNSLSSSGFDIGNDLEWLQWTRMRYGCIARWCEDSHTVPRLRIESEYRCEEGSDNSTGQELTAEAFPGKAMLANSALSTGQDIVMMAPIPGVRGNQGLLLLVGPIESELRDHVGSIRDWAALLGASLERAHSADQVRKNSLRDPLTGLPSRMLLLDRIDQALMSAKKAARAASVMLVGLDGFKNVNESLGYLAGDRLLLEVARRLQAILPEVETIARLSGDEFAVVLSDVECSADALPYVGRIQQGLKAPFAVDGEPIVLSCSIGVAMSSERYTSAEALLRDADTAMNYAKRSGRSRYQVFDAAMHEQALERLRLESQLRRALENEEFVLHYQPLVALRSGQLVGAEALIRWNHPERGAQLPAQFLAVAEEAGLAIPISRWVLDTAMREAHEWRSLYPTALIVNVNVPAAHFADATFAEQIRRLLAKYDLSPAVLGLELVESSLVENQATTIRVLEQLKRIGCHTAIDDFGTGYSSLSYLQLLPVRVLKIDRRFVRGVEGSASDAAIATTIITMAHSLGLQVVAEGVENQAQLDFLQAHECDMAQGFFFSAALPADEWRRTIEEWAAARAPISGHAAIDVGGASDSSPTKKVV